MLALELDARLQGGNLVFGYALRRKPRASIASAYMSSLKFVGAVKY